MNRPGPWVIVTAAIERLALENIAITVDGSNVDEVLAAAQALLDALGVTPAGPEPADPEGPTSE